MNTLYLIPKITFLELWLVQDLEISVVVCLRGRDFTSTMCVRA